MIHPESANSLHFRLQKVRRPQASVCMKVPPKLHDDFFLLINAPRFLRLHGQEDVRRRRRGCLHCGKIAPSLAYVGLLAVLTVASSAVRMTGQQWLLRCQHVVM